MFFIHAGQGVPYGSLQGALGIVVVRVGFSLKGAPEIIVYKGYIRGILRGQMLGVKIIVNMFGQPFPELAGCVKERENRVPGTRTASHVLLPRSRA